jgi:RNA-splicing ligase RtcB
VNKGTIDESPMAYKDMGEIMANISETVNVLRVVRPVYNYKAG